MPEPSQRLRADCARCFALCCVGPALAASADFAIDKPAGRACPNLVGFGCGIHDRLRPSGFPGCAAYDCFGAGQQVAQVTFGGRDWRAYPELAGQMFTALAVMRQLHELLWYLAEALRLAAAAPVHGQLRRAYRQTSALTRTGPDELIALDVAAHRNEVNPLLVRASRLARDPAGPELAGSDLVGRNLRGADLRGAS
ncbi:MAG: pentapeptide repeat-containing protein, partial [Micromonosporaceae bacterium]|nr:pentapeptide repeat-containing protein [Micromonosporaceae bacterium]